MSKVQSIIEEIKGLSLLEASELVKGLEEAFGVSAAAATMAAAPAAGGGGAATGGLRANARDAHGRSKTPCVTPGRALRSRGIPWLSRETVRAPPPLPAAGRQVSSANAVWRLRRSERARAHGGARMVQAVPFSIRWG